MMGTTTMKMIKSTSTTSTSVVMLITECSWEPSLWTCMISVSLRLGAVVLCDQPHPMEAGLLDRAHGLPDHAEAEPGVAPDHDLDVRLLGARRGAEPVAETLGRDRLIVDPQPAGLVDGDQDPVSLVALLARLRRVRQVDVRSLVHLRRHDHGDDQQHQHHVDERRDVDGRLDPARLNGPHGPPSRPFAVPGTGSSR